MNKLLIFLIILMDPLEALYHRNTRKKGAKNLNCAVIGESGSGKSWLCLRFSDQYYKRYLKINFSVDNVVFTITEFLELVKTLPNCSIIIFDDAGLKYSSKRWWDELNQILGYTMQSFRYKIINVFFTIPILKWLDNVGRGMLHSRIEMKDPGIAVYKKLEYNPSMDKIYETSLYNFDVSRPPLKLVNAYEKKKDNFLKQEYEQYYLQALKREEKPLTIGPEAVDHYVNIVLNDLDRFSLKGKLNRDIIQVELKTSFPSTRLIFSACTKILEEKKEIQKYKEAG